MNSDWSPMMTSNHFKIKSNPRMSIDENNNRDKFNLFPINHLPDIHENNNRKQLADLNNLRKSKMNKSIDYDNSN
jgi:hypothetical protein